MVPVKSTVWSDDSFTTYRRTRRIASKRNVSPASVRKSRTRSRDNSWFVLVAIAILVFSIAGAVSSIKAGFETALNPTAARQFVIGVKVKPGDTLWTFARRYGAPGNYILDRVESIARDNGLDPSTALVPGQTLQVHVENPAVIAKLERSQRVASAFE